MMRQAMKLGGSVLIVVCALALAVTALSAQQKSVAPKTTSPKSAAHPVEGTYNGTAHGTENPVTFSLVIKRNGVKWSCNLQNSSIPITITGLTVNKENVLTITGTTNDAPVTMTGKYKGGKIDGTWTVGDSKGTWSAAKRQ